MHIARDGENGAAPSVMPQVTTTRRAASGRNVAPHSDEETIVAERVLKGR